MPGFPKHSRGSRQHGFTLLELMVVVLIMGLFVGLVSVNLQPDEREQLDVETRRLARLLELVAAEARVSGSSFAWSAETDAYRFLQLNEAGGWLDVHDNDTLRPRRLPAGMRISGLLVENAPVEQQMRVEFPAYGQTNAFTVALVYGAAVSRVVVSPIGAVVGVGGRWSAVVIHAGSVKRAAGFTLVEVLVALAIIAVALMAALRAAGQGTTQAGDLRARLLASAVAENRLAEHAARGDWLPVGIVRGTELQAGIEFAWREEVIGTPNPAFHRVDVFVYLLPDEARVLARFTGYSVNPPGPDQ